MRTLALASLVFALAFPPLVAACSDDAANTTPAVPASTLAPTASPTASSPPTPTKACATLGETQCDGGRVQTCVADGKGNQSWGPKSLCAKGNQVCKGSACVDAVPDAVAQLTDIDRVAQFVFDYHGWRGAVDEKAAKEDARLALLLGDGSGETFFRVSQALTRKAPSGHGGMYSLHTATNQLACGKNKEDKIAFAGASYHGICGAVSGQGIAITVRRPIANIDLFPGDTIVKVTNGSNVYEGASMLDELGELPICSATQPLSEAQRDVTAASILSIVRPGWILGVKGLSGVVRNVTVPERLQDPLSCADGFNRKPGVDRFTVTLRPDQNLVVWIKTFAGTAAFPFPSTFEFTAYKKWVSEWIVSLNAEIAKYPTAKGIIWDVRGNNGGSQDLAVALAMGPKGPTNFGGLYKCLARIPATHPAAFEPTSTVPRSDPTKVLGVPEMDGMSSLFSFAGKQVVVSSGNIYSAADVFVYAAKAAGLPVVGRRGPGAFGASAGAPYKILDTFLVKDIPIYAYQSGWSCVDSAGSPLEGKSPALDVAVDLLPADLAAGKDTQIEEAAKLLNR